MIVEMEGSSGLIFKIGFGRLNVWIAMGCGVGFATQDLANLD
jgi:hypothetical protein